MSNAAQFIASTLLWKGSVLLLVAGGLCLLLRKTSASVRHWLWCLAFAALLLLLVLPAVLPHWELSVLPPAAEPRSVAPHVGALSVTETTPTTRWAWLGGLWLIGFFFFVGRMAFDLETLRRIRLRSRPFPRNRQRLLIQCLRDLGLNRSVEIVLTHRAPVPMTGAIFRPVILLPEVAGRWSDERLQCALIHELAHWKRHDCLTTWFSQVICALYWMNPLVWLAARKLCLEREQACDELVLRSGTERFRYAEQLLELARQLQPVRQGAGLAMADKAGLKHRIQKILDSNPGAFLLNRRTAVLITLAALVVIVPLTLIQLRERAVATRSNPALDASLALLRDGSPSEKKKAAWFLGEEEDAGAVEPLVHMLADPDPELRGLAAWALGEIKDRRAMAPLVGVLDDGDAYAREMIVRAIGEFEDPEAVPHLEGVLDDPNVAVRSAAVWSLGEIRNREALRVISTAAADPNARVQVEAIQVLVDAGEDVPPTSLIDALSNPDARVRQEAARALGKIGDPQAVEVLIDRLRDPDPEVRAWTVWALDEIHVGR